MQVKGRQTLPLRKSQTIWGCWTQVDPVVSCAGHCHQVAVALQEFPDQSCWFDLTRLHPYFPLLCPVLQGTTFPSHPCSLAFEWFCKKDVQQADWKGGKKGNAQGIFPRLYSASFSVFFVAPASPSAIHPHWAALAKQPQLLGILSLPFLSPGACGGSALIG